MAAHHRQNDYKTNLGSKVYVAKSNVSSSKTWDMVTLKVGDHNWYHIKSNTVKLFFVKQAVNGKW